uniref:Peptidase S1 domain-containing protein n=1 Tax=Glossina brevipalpis TaxID=37001 RepID=A0A1A9WY28_9MUSC
MACWGYKRESGSIFMGAGVIIHEYAILTYHGVDIMHRQWPEGDQIFGFVLYDTEFCRFSSALNEVSWFSGYSLQNKHFVKVLKTDPQLAIIKVNEALKVSSVMPLPQKHPNIDAKCVVIGWQQLLMSELKEIEVEVWSYTKCLKNITTLFTKALCIYMYEPCLLLNGGEPLICDGILTGIVSSEFPICTNSSIRICTDVFQYRGWINEHLQLLGISKSNIRSPYLMHEIVMAVLALQHNNNNNFILLLISWKI